MNGWKRTFIIIWSGQLLSSLSSSIVSFAIVFWLSMKSGSAEVLAYAMIATLLPFIVLGLFTGVYIDRWNRRKIMIYADAFVAICAAILGILFYYDKVEIWEVYLLLALRSVGSAFHSPAMQASVPLIAPQHELMRVAGVSQIIYSISNIAGPAIGATVVMFLQMKYIMLIDIIGAAIACISLMFVSIPNPVKLDNRIPNVMREVKEGLGHLFGSRGLTMLLICVIVVTFFMMPLVALYPLMTLNHFMGNAFKMGIVEISWGAGMLIGGAIVNISIIKRANKALLINSMTIILGLTFYLSGILSNQMYVFFVVLTAISGITGSIFWSAFTVILQTKVEPSALGRVFSIYDSISLLPSIPGLMATGFIAESIGLLNAFVIAGIATVLVGIIAFCIPSITRLGRIENN